MRKVVNIVGPTNTVTVASRDSWDQPMNTAGPTHTVLSHSPIVIFVGIRHRGTTGGAVRTTPSRIFTEGRHIRVEIPGACKEGKKGQHFPDVMGVWFGE